MLCSSPSVLVGAQYYGYQQHEGAAGYESAGGSGGYDYGMDERPKLNLGIRLRIPAFKFELPRFSLPKITVSAKIRQPDKPRVITLPEINLDTTSKAEPPGDKSGGHGGSYGGNSYGPAAYKASSSNYQQPAHSYGHQENSQTFTFSTDEETPASYGNNYQSGNNYQPRQYGHTKPMQSPIQYAHYKQTSQYAMRHRRQPEQADYRSATMSRPFHNIYERRPAGGNYQAQPVQSAASAISQESAPLKNPDLGFNSPVQVNPDPQRQHARVRH